MVLLMRRSRHFFDTTLWSIGAGERNKSCSNIAGTPFLLLYGVTDNHHVSCALDQTIIATLLTEVGEKFNAFGKVNWISSAFMLPNQLSSAVRGKFSVGSRKYGILLAIVLFEVGSLICALANSMDI